jgi:2'-5' RNA ligase
VVVSGTPHFVGIELDDESRHRLAAGLTAVFEDHPVPGLRVPAPNWHLTLRYLGPVPPPRLDAIIHGLASASLGERFRLRLDGLGAFPRPEQATVLWVGTAEGTEELHLLRDRVEDALEATGMPREDRPFEPHVTLSRIRPPVDVWTWLEADPLLDVRVDVDAVTLFRSERRPTSYPVVERFPL